ncbi:MAG TPA: PKD domain-containing protein, partial [Thermoplasmata archaeon]|nr:PKD domain-containing protein [Thermoplasmata archaeon]
MALVGMLIFSGYGTIVPSAVRCALPASVSCPGGFLGAALPGANASLEQWFNVTMYDYGFWITNTVDGTNETQTWVVFEGWTVHVNATSLPANGAAGGTAYHGLGVEINATGSQLLSLAAPVGRWVTGMFVAPNHVYYSQHIWCTVYCGSGHSGQYRYNLNIVPSTAFPSVTVTAQPKSGPAPLSVSFTSMVVGGSPPYSGSWDFGDGTSAYSGLNASHTYSLVGTYSARLTVTDSASHQASANVSISATGTTPLAATLRVGPGLGVAPLEVSLSGSATGGVQPYQFSWDLGDGSVAAAASATHLYSAPGHYAPVLTVTDSRGQSATAVASVNVTRPLGTFPVTASASPPSGPAPADVAFSVQPTGGTGPFAYDWLFGDGSAASGPSPTHLFSTNGLYEVTLIADDSSGRVGVATTQVSITGSSGAALSALLLETPGRGAPPLLVNASVSIEGGTEPYAAPTWALGDGTTASGSVVDHTYPRGGSYTIQVQVSDALGATATVDSAVSVEGIGIAISLNRTSGDAPFSLRAAASIVGGTGTYGTIVWDWGDGFHFAGSPVTHAYSASTIGRVDVRAMVADDSGAIASSSENVTIRPPPLATVLVGQIPSPTPPVSVGFRLLVTGGTGNYSTEPLWNFGDGTTTRGVGPVNHTFHRTGHYRVLVQTNDSA